MSLLKRFEEISKYCKVVDLFYSICLSVILISFFTNVAVAQVQTKIVDERTIAFETALFSYFTEQYVQAVIRFEGIIEAFPEWTRKKEAINYLVLSLSRLHFSEQSMSIIKDNNAVVTGATLLDITENALLWGNQNYAFQYLRILSQKSLISSDRNTFLFLMARTLVSTGDGDEAIRNLNLIPDSDILYFTANILRARIIFQKREAEKALALLKELQIKISKNQHNLRFNGESEEVALLSAQIYFELGKYTTAASLFSLAQAGKWKEEALVGGAWSFFKSQEYEKAIPLLERLKERFPTRFTQDNLLPVLSFSYFYGNKYILAAEHLKDLQSRSKLRKELMEMILSDDKLCRFFSFVVLDTVFGTASRDSLLPPEATKKIVENLEVQHDALLSLEGIYYLSLLQSRLRNSLNVVIDKYSLFKNRYDFVTRSIESLQRNNDRLEVQYNRLKGKVLSSRFASDKRAVSNDTFIQEWSKDNISKYAGEMKRELTIFEKKIIDIYTQSILYSQKTESNFIKQIIVGENSFENLHNKSITVWRDRVDALSGTDNKFVGAMKLLGSIKKELEGISEETHAVNRKIFVSVFQYIKKEAFRVVLETSYLEKEIKDAYRVSLAYVESQKKIRSKRRDISE